MFNITHVDRAGLDEAFQLLNLNEYNVEFNLIVDENKDLDCYVYHLDYDAKYYTLNHLICNILTDNFTYTTEEYHNVPLKGVVKINSEEVIIIFNRPIIVHKLATTNIQRKI